MNPLMDEQTSERVGNVPKLTQELETYLVCDTATSFCCWAPAQVPTSVPPLRTGPGTTHDQGVVAAGPDLGRQCYPLSAPLSAVHEHMAGALSKQPVVMRAGEPLTLPAQGGCLTQQSQGLAPEDLWPPRGPSLPRSLQLQA